MAFESEWKCYSSPLSVFKNTSIRVWIQLILAHFLIFTCSYWHPELLTDRFIGHLSESHTPSSAFKKAAKKEEKTKDFVYQCLISAVKAPKNHFFTKVYYLLPKNTYFSRKCLYRLTLGKKKESNIFHINIPYWISPLSQTEKFTSDKHPLFEQLHIPGYFITDITLFY